MHFTGTKSLPYILLVFVLIGSCKTNHQYLRPCGVKRAKNIGDFEPHQRENSVEYKSVRMLICTDQSPSVCF